MARILGQIDGPSTVTITVRGIISNSLAAQRADLFTNAVTSSYYDDGQFYQYTTSVEGEIKEPELAIAKAVLPSTGVRADTVLTYTLVVEHAVDSNATAYDVVITDVVPANLVYTPDSLRVSSPSGTVISATLDNSLTITISEYPDAVGADLYHLHGHRGAEHGTGLDLHEHGLRALHQLARHAIRAYR